MKKSITLFTVMMLATVPCMAQNVIKSNMLINISVAGVPIEEKSRISAQYLVDGSGNFSLPLIDEKIKASGLTGPALADKLSQIYKDAGIYSSPVFTIVSFQNNENEAAVLREIQAREDKIRAQEEELRKEKEVVYVTGHAKAPGKFKLTHQMTIRHALSECGGDGEWGSAERVILKRDGKESEYNYVEKPEVLNIKLQSGDFLDIPQGRGFSSKK
jgi:protein involved in polysaccharide export with SLBB domain